MRAKALSLVSSSAEWSCWLPRRDLQCWQNVHQSISNSTRMQYQNNTKVPSPQSQDEKNYLIRCQQDSFESIRQRTLDEVHSDDFYEAVTQNLSMKVKCGSMHSNTMIAVLAVTVLFRTQNDQRCDALKYLIIDRIRLWTHLSRLNSSKISFLSQKIYRNRSHKLYIAKLGDWHAQVNVHNSFYDEAIHMLYMWKAIFPRKLSFYQVQLEASKLEKALQYLNYEATARIRIAHMEKGESVDAPDDSESDESRDQDFVDFALMSRRRGQVSFASVTGATAPRITTTTTRQPSSTPQLSIVDQSEEQRMFDLIDTRDRSDHKRHSPRFSAALFSTPPLYLNIGKYPTTESYIDVATNSPDYAASTPLSTSSASSYFNESITKQKMSIQNLLH